MGKHSVSSYEMFCDCGQRIEFERPAPKSSDVVMTVRERCPACQAAVCAVVTGKDAYKPRQTTLELQWAILGVFAEIAQPMTVRQMYYQLSARHVVAKDESGYNKVQRALTDMRRAGAIPYSYLADNSRAIYEVDHYRGLDDALTMMHRYYRRDMWENQPAHVEIWVEKRALISQIWPICNEYGVRLFPCGGYASISFIYEAAEEWEDLDKPIYVYHLSDLDADGAYSSVTLERELRSHTAHPIHFRRLALDFDQVYRYSLRDALRPQKPTSKRYKWWCETYGRQSMACELDALHPDTLRTLVRDAIESHLDRDELENVKRIEAAERRSLAMMTASYKKQQVTAN